MVAPSESQASPPAVHVAAVVTATEYAARLSAEAANALYNEIVNVQRMDPAHFHGRFPIISAIYNGLYQSGCDGSD